MGKKLGLGRGLQALIPITSREENVLNDFREEIREIEIDKIRPKEQQARRRFNEEKIYELAESIREHGVVQPIIVRPITGGRYEIVAGERRWRACCFLELKTIMAIVKEYRDMEADAIALIENIQREDLNPIEEARAYQELMEKYNLTQEEISRKVGKSRPFIGNIVRLLALPKEVRSLVEEDKITAGHARALLAAYEKEKQLAIAAKIIKNGLSVRETEKLVKKVIEEGRVKRERKAGDERISLVEKELKQLLKADIRIIERIGGAGKIEIRYNSREHLEEMIGIIMR